MGTILRHAEMTAHELDWQRALENPRLRMAIFGIIQPLTKILGCFYGTPGYISK